MALQWADTFNKYGTTVALLLNGLYAEVNSSALVTDPDPTSTQKVLQHTPNVVVNEGFRFVYPSGSANTMGFSTRLWMATLPVSNGFQPAWEFRDSGNSPQVSILINTTGTISAVRGTSVAGGGTLLGTTTVPVVTANAYSHIEAKVTIDPSAGSVEVRVNGASVLLLTGINTKATGTAGTAQLVYIARIGAPVTYHKDFIVWDTTGSFNNNFLGTVRCIDTLTDGDNSFTWTASTGSNGWSILDNIPPLDDAAYISAASNLTSVFTLANLPATVSSVRGNVITVRARKEDSGDGNIQAGLKSGASTGLGANRAITTAYTFWVDVNETDPATSAAWTPTSFNSALFQLARTV